MVCSMAYDASGGAQIWCEAQMMGNRQERKHRRFQLECPVFVKFHAATSAAEVEAVSKNISIGGILVRSAAMIPKHALVTFIISVQGGQAFQPIYLAGEGEVVRVESNGRAFMIAVRCDSPITQLQDYPSIV